MNARNIMLFAAGGSLALLLGAFIFQALGYAPCKLCIWQRWPHAVAIGAGVLVFLTGPLLIWGMVGAASAALTGAIGVYHTGIERDWWEGPADCTGSGDTLSGLSGTDLLSTDGPLGVVMCDEVAWAFAGVSMASWNAIFSFGLALVWLMAVRRRY